MCIKTVYVQDYDENKRFVSKFTLVMCLYLSSISLWSPGSENSYTDY